MRFVMPTTCLSPHEKAIELDPCNSMMPLLETIRGNEISYIFQEPMTALHPLVYMGQQVVEAIAKTPVIIKLKQNKGHLTCFEEMQLPDARTDCLIVIHINCRVDKDSE